MAPRRTKLKMKSLTEIMRANRRVSSEPGEQQVEFDIPTEVLELILSQLNLRDNIRASAVCRSWLTVAASVRRVNRPPWLMFFPKYGEMYEFYDPSQRKTYSVEIPQLRGSRVCYAKDGWLLLFKPGTKDIFFFCPYTREMIELPKLQLAHKTVAFSAAPTCPNCLLFAIKNVTDSFISVSTCRPGETQWSTAHYDFHLSFCSIIWNKIVFCDGRFFCLSDSGELGIYLCENMTWTVLLLPPARCTEYFNVQSSWRAKFMAEHDGDIFVVYVGTAVNPVIYKFSQRHRKKWVEMESLGGMTLFASFLSSHAMTDIVGKMRSNVCFSKVLLYGKRCVTYSPDAGRYYPRNQLYDWDEQDPFESIWIESPEDPSIFLQRSTVQFCRNPLQYHVFISHTIQIISRAIQKVYFTLLGCDVMFNFLLLMTNTCSLNVEMGDGSIEEVPTSCWPDPVSFVSTQQVYIDDVEDMLDEFILSLSSDIGDGSIEEDS